MSWDVFSSVPLFFLRLYPTFQGLPSSTDSSCNPHRDYPLFSLQNRTCIPLLVQCHEISNWKFSIMNLKIKVTVTWVIKCAFNPFNASYPGETQVLLFASYTSIICAKHTLPNSNDNVLKKTINRFDLDKSSGITFLVQSRKSRIFMFKSACKICAYVLA